MTNTPDITAQLNLLKDRFRLRLKNTHDDMLSWQNTPETLSQLLETCHKLAGTAGTYGYEALSTDMKEFEQRLLNMSEQEKQRVAPELFKQASTLIAKNL